MTNYDLEYRGVTCIAADWETTPYKFTFLYKGHTYLFEQKREIWRNADTDHIRCVIEQFLEDIDCSKIICGAEQRKYELESEECKMKYKVGDKVRIVSKWGKDCHQNSEGKMDKWLGKVMTIRDHWYGRYYKMKEDETEHREAGWFWNENCIAGLACEKKIVITTDGTETLARLYDGKKVVKTATAKCSPDDKFDFEMGAKYAFYRLLNKDDAQEEPKYFSGKAVCIKPFYGFTIGKIYEFTDGQCVDDCGRVRPRSEKLKDFSYFSEFLPVAE